MSYGLPYMGSKRTRLANELERYNKYRGWDVPENENPADEGFLVEYLDGGQLGVALRTVQ